MRIEDFELIKFIIKAQSKSILFWDELSDLQYQQLKDMPSQVFEEIILFTIGKNIQSFLKLHSASVKNIQFFNINKNINFEAAKDFCNAIKSDLRAIAPNNNVSAIKAKIKEYNKLGYMTNFNYINHENVNKGEIPILDLNAFTMDGKYLMLEASSRGICQIQNLMIGSKDLSLKDLTHNKLCEVANRLEPDTVFLSLDRAELSLLNTLHSPARNQPIKALSLYDIFGKQEIGNGKVQITTQKNFDTAVDNFDGSLSFIGTLKDNDPKVKNPNIGKYFKKFTINSDFASPITQIIPAVFRKFKYSSAISQLELQLTTTNINSFKSVGLQYTFNGIKNYSKNGEFPYIENLILSNFTTYLPLATDLKELLTSPDQQIETLTINDYKFTDILTDDPNYKGGIIKSLIQASLYKTCKIKELSFILHNFSGSLLSKELIKDIFAQELRIEKFSLTMYNIIDKKSLILDENHLSFFLEQFSLNQPQLKHISFIVNELTEQGITKIQKIALQPNFNLYELNVKVLPSFIERHENKENDLYEALRISKLPLYFNNKPSGCYREKLFEPISYISGKKDIMNIKATSKIDILKKLKAHENEVTYIMKKEIGSDFTLEKDSLYKNVTKEIIDQVAEQVSPDLLPAVLGKLNLGDSD
jgi:hypothetical protein